MSGIGVNLRVTGHCSQGGRAYMEDMFSVAYQQTEDLNDLEYAFFGIFDGHGGKEAANYAKNHLLDSIVQQKSFWSKNDEDVLEAIHEGYMNTHQAMWKDQVKWKRTAAGLLSTSGTTATVAFIMRSKIYIGHVGDSMLVLGYQDEDDKNWKCLELTKEHKPEAPEEIKRITESGGKVVRKNGVPRVVWNRPKHGHKGPVRRSTAFDEIPFLAVARALGDFWSYNSDLDKFVVSPEPDVGVIKMDTLQHKCLIFGTDGLWNMLSAQDAVNIVQYTEKRNGLGEDSSNWLNPSKYLVDEAIDKWLRANSRPDNTSVVTLLIDPPGPPPRPKVKVEGSSTDSSNQISDEKKLPESGSMAFFTRSPGSPKQELINSLFKHTASLSSVSTSSNKNRAISNVLRPWSEILKAKQEKQATAEVENTSLNSQDTDSHQSDTESTIGASDTTSQSPSEPYLGQYIAVVTRSRSPIKGLPPGIPVIKKKSICSPDPKPVRPPCPKDCDDGCNFKSYEIAPSAHVLQKIAADRAAKAALFAQHGVETRSSKANASGNGSNATKSNPMHGPSISPNDTSKASNSLHVSNTSVSSPTNVSTRTTLPSISPNMSTRSSNSTPSPVSTPVTRSSYLSPPSGSKGVLAKRDLNGSWKPNKNSNNPASSNSADSVTSPRRRGVIALTNQSTGCTSTMNTTKRKRFRMDEKRSSLPLNAGFEESSGNSDTENEHDAASTSPTPQASKALKKQKLERQSSASSTSRQSQGQAAATSSHTRTLRSDTSAAIPVMKTLRNRNVNMSPLSEPLRGRGGSAPQASRTSTSRSSTVLSQNECRPRTSGVHLNGLAESLRSRSRR